MRGLKVLLGTTALIVGMAFAPATQAPIAIDIGVQPSCPYGYYGYAPYQCAPMGYYGPGYFYNGIFLGMGPWGGWGYSHGWGSHRFANEGGGRYHGGPGNMSYHENHGGGQRGGGSFHGNAPMSHGGGQQNHGGGARPNAGHQAAPSHNGGGQQNHGGGGGGGQSHGGGGGGHGGGGGGDGGGGGHK